MSNDKKPVRTQEKDGGLNKRPQIPKKNEVSLVRSSAAEYLTFVAATGNAETSVEMRYENENIWLTQKMMATLYDVSVPAISQHLKRIYADNELERDATVKQYLTVQTEGNRSVQRSVEHYSLQAIIAVGFKIENERAVQFRKWANQIVRDYTIQGWAMDVDRLKHGGSILDNEFFERQLQKVREIRLSERKFYQKITDIYATSLDYDPTATDWELRLGGFLKLWDREVLQDAGKVTAEIAKAHAESEFEKYRIVQDRLFESDFDRLINQTETTRKPTSGDSGM